MAVGYQNIWMSTDNIVVYLLLYIYNTLYISGRLVLIDSVYYIILTVTEKY